MTRPEPEPARRCSIRVTRAGINFADTHARENAYLARYELPLDPGRRGRGHAPRTAGARVVALIGTGGYAEYVAAPRATDVSPIPDGVSDGDALALMIQGLTAWHLYRTSAQLAPGESRRRHAAAGGVGSLAVQLGKALGAGRVIATASTEEKRALALELGADAAVDAGAGGSRRRARRGQRGRAASTSCWRWPAGACSTPASRRSRRSGASSSTASPRASRTRSRTGA